MSKRRYDEDILVDALSKQRTETSKDAREKSLHSFKVGLLDANTQYKNRKRGKFRKQLIGLSSTIAAAGIMTLLAFSTGIFGEHNKDGTNIQLNDDNQGPQNIHSVIDNQMEDTSKVEEKIWNRQPLEFDDWERFQPMGIFNDDLVIYLPQDWTFDETEDEDTYSTRITGADSEQMNLVLFQKDDQEVFDSHLQELTKNFSETGQISIPVAEFVDELKSNQQVPFIYNNVFPFDIENAEMIIFVDQANGKLVELYTSELFGYQMIFTSELSLNDVASWNLPIHIFATMRIHKSLTWQGKEGKLHPEFNRPIVKTVVLPIGATATPDKVEMELYENEELHITSYLPKGTEIQRIEHEHFAEWRFTEPDTSKNSFYSFGKLKSNFPLEDGKETMFKAFDIDQDYSPMEDGDIPHHYSYDSANAGEGIGIGGYFELSEANGEWYYVHKHANWQEYNGGYLSSRLNYFIDSMEWH